MASGPVIELAAALLVDARQGLVLVRKRGTLAYMQPGGKIAPGERPIDTLVREIAEELGLQLSPDTAVPLGLFKNEAANEPGQRIRVHLFGVTMGVGDVPLTPQAEIAEIAVVGPGQTPRLPLAPFTKDQVLPLWYDMIKTTP